MAEKKKRDLNKKVYYPSKTFDDDYRAFVDLSLLKEWVFPGVDQEKLIADPEIQRAQRAEHDALESKYFALHEQLGLDQEARYNRFAAALNAARGAFRKDKVIMAELNRFKRSVRRTKKVETTTDQKVEEEA